MPGLARAAVVEATEVAGLGRSGDDGLTDPGFALGGRPLGARCFRDVRSLFPEACDVNPA
jgi:hypothetical protein